MAFDLLDAPVRLTWDLTQDSRGDLGAVAGAIAEAGVFYVTLQGEPLLRPEIADVVDALAAGGCQVLLVCGGSDAELSRLAGLKLKIQRVLLDISGFVTAAGVDQEALLGAVELLRQAGHEPTLMLTPLRGNLSYIPDLLGFCRVHAVTRFKLSNASIGASFHRYPSEELPRPADLASFRRLWHALPPDEREGPQLEIHDLFLWEIMTPGEQQARSEYGGCQAGNSLGHVDVHGNVYPCAAWPEPLGRLPAQQLENIWAGAARLAVRDHLAALPQGCAGCAVAETCLGGCRGLACFLNREQGERDLMCPSPR